MEFRKALSTDNTRGDANTPDADAILRSIGATQEHLTGTVHELEERLSLTRLRAIAREKTIGKVEQMAQNITGSAKYTGSSFVQTIKDNPIPSTLCGIGVAWLLYNRRSARKQGESSRLSYVSTYDRQDVGEVRQPTNGHDGQRASRAGEMVDETRHKADDISQRAGQSADDMRKRLGETTDRAGEKVEETRKRMSGVASRAGDKARDLADNARHGARRLEDRFNQALQDNPLALGGIAIGMGLALGFALPRTRREDELFGRTRSRMLERAEHAALGVAEKGEQRIVDKIGQSASGQVSP